MIKVFFILISLILPTKYTFADWLNCAFDDYSRTSTRTPVVKSWVNITQNHSITGDSIRWDEKNLSGRITKNNNDKIQWKYETKRKMVWGSVRKDVRLTYKYVYFKKSKKVSVDVVFKSYKDIEGVWGKCTYNVAAASNIINKSNDNSSSIFSSENISTMDNDSICAKAVSYSGKWETKQKYIKHVQEAKRRGLSCGVKDDEEEKLRLAEEKARQERIKAEQDQIKKKEEARKKKIAEAKARQKKIAEEKARQKKKAEEEARKKRLAEEKRKQELARAKLNKQIINYKRKAVNFYKDIENYVKSGGNVDLVKLSDFFDVKPNPKDNWNQSDLSRYEKLREFMISIPQFVSYEKERIGERLKNSFAMKDKSVAELKQNLSELKTLMRNMFGSNEVPKIKDMIKDIQSTLSDFNQSVANKVISQSSTYIASKSPKPKEEKRTTKVVSTSDSNWQQLEGDLTIQQQQFCQLTDRFYDNLNVARKSKNEIKVNMVHKERQENLDALIPQGKINNWIFKVVKIDQVEDGSAAVVLGLQCRSFVGSGQTIDIKRGMSNKDKKEWRATIPYNDRRFRELAKLNQGQFIVGSGTMLEINAYRPGQKETFYASQQIGEHPLTKGLNLEGELFIADLSYIAALN